MGAIYMYIYIYVEDQFKTSSPFKKKMFFQAGFKTVQRD